jgi:lysophospholipid acyltransferase (LPLAT)-like uncharacterized protein
VSGAGDGVPAAAAAPPPEDARALARRARDARRVRWAVRLGVPLIRLLARTWRVREVGREGWLRCRAERRPVIVALWHGQMLPLVEYHRDQGVSVLISEHRDGEIIARVVEALGFRTIRGSTSRGGARALLEIVRTLRRGEEVAITPDGPRGPRHSFAGGALVAAQRSGAPVIPVLAHVSRAWRLRSWDRFEIPKPFARIVVAYGEPTYVEAATAQAAAEEAPRFEALMHAVAETAERAAR